MDDGNEMSLSLNFASSSYLSIGSSSQNLSAAATGCSNLDNLSLNKLSTNLETLLIDSEYEYSDAEIVVEDIPVGVHRSILAARSQFFHRLFKWGNVGEVEKGKPRYSMSNLVPYGTVGLEAFNVFLSYLYTGKLKPSPLEVSTCVDDDCAHDACRPAINYAVELMYASATFEIKELVAVVQRRLLNFVDKAFVEDVIPILVVAFHCQLNQLLSNCIHRVARSVLDNISLEKELPYEVSREIIFLRLKSLQEAKAIVPEVVMDPLHEKRIRRIHKALDSDDFELVKMLLRESNITLDQAYALHYAAAYCDPKIVMDVLNLDMADLNCRNGQGHTILHVAARRKEPSILVALLRKGASASERTVDGQTAVTICRRLTRPKDYNEKTNQGQESNKDRLCIDVLEREIRGSSISVNMAISSQVIADNLSMKLHYYENRGMKDDYEALKSVLANTQSMAASQSHATRLPLSNPFEDVLSWPKMWAKLTANPATQTDLQNKDFVRIMHELHNIYLKDKRVIQALGVLLNISFWMPTSADTEMPESLSLLSLPLEWKKGTEAKPAKELDLMELKAEEGMDKKPQAFKEQELDNAAYDKNDLDTVIAHYTKVMELGDGDISCLINRAIAYLAMGQYEECINDCDKAIERGRQLKSDSKMIEIALTTKGTALVKMAKLSKDNVPTIETYQKTLSEHRNPDTLKKLNDAKEVKRELEQQEYLDTKLADEEHGKDPDVEVVALSPKTLLATNKFVCEICNKGFKREQNLQLHRQGHYLSWKPSQRSSKDVKRKVYVCPEPSCVHHDPSRALGDLMGIKKHFCRKHSKKKWKCNKCSKKYAIWSDWKAHSKICGTRVYKCDCGTLFSRKDSFIMHQGFCDALAEVSARAQTQPVVNPNSKSDTEIRAVDDQGQSYSPSWLFKNLHNTSLNPNPGSVSTVDSSPPTPAPARAQARLAPPQSTGVISLVLPIKSPEETSENEIASEHHGMEIDIEEVKMTDSSEQKKFEIEEIGNEASQTRQPDVIQVEDMQLQASNGQMESQIEDIEMEPEASEQCGLFLMQGGLGLTKLPNADDWKNAKEIYLMDDELSILPENPRCPNLSALFLPRNYKLRTIPPSFFDYMPALQILNLSRTGIKSLPDSLIRLVSLKRLFLNDCYRLMTLSPKVGNLKLLEVLDLEGAKIMDLPMEIKELTNLNCLEVSFYGYMSNGRRAMQSNAVVPCGVISALSQLEELNIDVNPDDEWWDACVENIVTEVCTLTRLETLKFYFPRVELLRHFHCNRPLLSHFRFTVGRHVKRIMSRVPLDVEFELERWERCLRYINGVGVPRDIKNVLQHVTAFFLDRHVTVKKLSDFGTRNMKQLKCCVVGECNEVQVIMDAQDAYGEDGISEIVSESYDAERIVLGSLEYLYIYYMKSLRSIWEGSVQKNSLFLLKSLTLRTCPQLTTIFTRGLLANLFNLEEIKVEDCPSIKSIVSCEISAEHRSSYFLPNLKKITLHYMPGLISISSGLQIAPKLEWLSFYNCPNLKNPLIDEISIQDLKKIKGERSWWEALEWSSSCPSYLEEIFVPIDIQDC